MDAERFDRLTRAMGSRLSRRTALAAGLAGVSTSRTSRATAQEATPAVEGEKPVFMFVQTGLLGRGEINPAAGTAVANDMPVPGGGANFLLTLEGHSGQTIYFSDRPDRIVGTLPTEDFLESFGFTPANPPNAALVAEFAAGDGVVVLELIEPVYDPITNVLTYGIEALQTYAGENLDPVLQEQVSERLPAEFARPALFIDDCADLSVCQLEIDATYYAKTIGPIPGGPYGQCWQGLFKGGCEPCWTSYGALNDLCNGAYSECRGRCFAAP